MDHATLERIRGLAIPPAYEEVWICSNPRGHLQATGRDARGRKQYRYHPQWRTVRDGRSSNAWRRSVLRCRACAVPASRPRGHRRDPRTRAGRDREPPRYARASASATTSTRGQTAVSASPRCATATFVSCATGACVSASAERGARARGCRRRQAPRQHCAALSRTPRPTLVPVSGRLRRAAPGRLRPGQRVFASGNGRRLHGQGFPDVGRDAPCGRASGEVAAPRPRHGAGCQSVHRRRRQTGGNGVAQHSRRLQELLYKSGGIRRVAKRETRGGRCRDSTRARAQGRALVPHVAAQSAFRGLEFGLGQCTAQIVADRLRDFIPSRSIRRSQCRRGVKRSYQARA